MRYILATGWEPGTRDFTKRLNRELSSGHKVLWLFSGGSNISASVKIMEGITSSSSRKLYVIPADERYGMPGHIDSNWAALMRAGFNVKHAHLMPVLQAGLSFDETVSYFQKLFYAALETVDVLIAQFGIGEDGHIAGILPDSPAAYETEAAVYGYHTEQYDRITITFPAIKRLTVSFAFAFGESKKTALKALKSDDLSLAKQPAQILKQLKEAYVYNDYVGENSV